MIPDHIQFPCLSAEIFAFSIGGFEFALRWYALAYIVGILIAWRLASWALNKESLWANNTPPMQPAMFEDLLSWLVLGIILGGRLGYVAFYNPQYYLDNPAQILMVWQGGMAFHGGFLGVVIAGIIYARRHGIKLLALADLIAMVSPPGLLLGRLANFVNAELWGRASDLPWAIYFPINPNDECAVRVYDTIARHPSQLYEALLEGLLLGAALLYLGWRRGALRKAGFITGMFIVSYGAARFMIEFTRQPDAQFVSAQNPLGLAWQINGYGLTQGQALSLPMIAVGLWLLYRAFGTKAAGNE